MGPKRESVEKPLIFVCFFEVGRQGDGERHIPGEEIGTPGEGYTDEEGEVGRSICLDDLGHKGLADFRCFDARCMFLI